MKKFIPFALVLLLAVGSLTSCEKQGAQLYDVKVMAYYDDASLEADPSGIEVTIKNTTTGLEETLLTGEKGIATFSLEEGIYSIVASNESDHFVFNGARDNITIQPSLNYVAVTLYSSAKSSGLIFKEIYYTGSKTPELTNYYADQFHEIYNNSDQIAYLDGLCIGVLEPSGSSLSNWVNPDGTIMDRLPVTYHALMFPGDGDNYPLQPWTSTVLAQDAINHQTDPLGNPASPVNLGNAPFETFIEAPGKDTDAPAAANMIVMYTTAASMYDWLHSVFGSAVIIFRIPTGTDYESFVNDPRNFMTRPGSTSSTKYFMVDKDWVLDAVEICNPDPTKQNKRLPVTLDAGKVSSTGTYISKSIRRKVAQVTGGHTVYKDTNNSTNDFVTNWTPTPFIHPAVVDTK